MGILIEFETQINKKWPKMHFFAYSERQNYSACANKRLRGKLHTLPGCGTGEKNCARSTFGPCILDESLILWDSKLEESRKILWYLGNPGLEKKIFSELKRNQNCYREISIVFKDSRIKKRTTLALLAAAIAIITVLSIALIIALLELKASEKILGELAIIKPGRSIAEIKERLGTPMNEFDKPEDVLEWGKVKDEWFCKGKKLYRFYASTPPCRALQVYTDTNDFVVFVTWEGL